MVFIFLAITIYLGIYAFSNPDSKSCWVVHDLESPMPTKEGAKMKADAMGIDVSEGYPVEMNKLFRTWFTWGFWSKIYLMVTSILFGSLGKYCVNASDFLGKISCGLYMLNGFVWIVFGAIWRYSDAGSIASGDKLERPEDATDEEWNNGLEAARKTNGYQFSSGTFMHLYVVCVFGGLFLLCAAGTFVTISTTCCCFDANAEK